MPTVDVISAYSRTSDVRAFAGAKALATTGATGFTSAGPAFSW
jgi:hypothetical protein